MSSCIKILVTLMLYFTSIVNGMVIDSANKDKESKSIVIDSANKDKESKSSTNSVEVAHEEKEKEHKGDKRLSIVDWAGYDNRDLEGPGTYAFGYDIEDAASNNVQFRSEERHPNGSVSGSYGYLEPDGNVRIVHYNADEEGFRTHEENSRRGMLKPIIIEGTPEATKIAGYSDKMLAALQSQKVHNTQKVNEKEQVQKVHEDHTRPKDQYMISVNTMPVTVAGFTLPAQKVFNTGYSEKVLTASSSQHVYIKKKIDEKKEVQKKQEEYTTPKDQYMYIKKKTDERKQVQKKQEEYTNPKDQYMIGVNAIPVTFLASHPLIRPKQPVGINYRGTNYFYFIPYTPQY